MAFLFKSDISVIEVVQIKQDVDVAKCRGCSRSSGCKSRGRRYVTAAAVQVRTVAIGAVAVCAGAVGAVSIGIAG